MLDWIEVWNKILKRKTGKQREDKEADAAGTYVLEIPSRLHHFPLQKQKVVPHCHVLVLYPQLSHSAPVPFEYMSLPICRIVL